MRLTKHHGLGNDFLVLLDPHRTHPLDDRVARALCDRHTGVGADGIIRATPALDAGARARMELRNADGSRAEMSGNGIRCLAQAMLLGWPADLGGEVPAGGEIPIETDAGRRTVTVHERVDRVTHSLSVAMGPARTGAEAPEWAGGPVARALIVDMGNPHLVLDLSAAPAGDAAEVDLVAIGESANAKLPGGVNVHLLTLAAPGGGAAPSERGIAIRTYERGVGLTRACGTGACAAAAAARAWGLTGAHVSVDMPGGRAEVTLGRSPDDAVVLRGPATYVAAIELGESPWR